MNERLNGRADSASREKTAAQRLMVQALLSLTETRDAETGRHSRRTQQYARLLAEQLATHPDFRAQLSPDRVDLLSSLAPIHDIVKVAFFGRGKPLEGVPIVEGTPWWDKDLAQGWKYDPERAKKLLAEAGASGAPFFLGVPNGRYLLDKQVGEAIAGYLEVIGLQVKFESPLWSSFVNEVTKYEKSKYDGFMFGWGVITGEPDQLMGDHFHSGAVKRTLYSNPEVDRLINEERESFDETRVRASLLRAQEIVWEECPWIWLLEQPDINAINRRLKWAAGRRDEYLLFHEATLGV